MWKYPRKQCRTWQSYKELWKNLYCSRNKRNYVKYIYIYQHCLTVFVFYFVSHQRDLCNWSTSLLTKYFPSPVSAFIFLPLSCRLLFHVLWTNGLFKIWARPHICGWNSCIIITNNANIVILFWSRSVSRHI